MSSVIYIYALRCPITNGIRYIGQSNQPQRRFELHLFAAKRNYHNHHCARWLALLLRRQLKPTLEILCQVPEGSDWREYERRYIAEAKANGAKLTNGTRGGEGVKPLDDHDKERMRLLRKAGMTPSVRARMGASVKASWADPAIREKRMIAIKANANLPHNKARLTAMSRRQKRDPSTQRFAGFSDK